MRSEIATARAATARVASETAADCSTPAVRSDRAVVTGPSTGTRTAVTFDAPDERNASSTPPSGSTEPEPTEPGSNEPGSNEPGSNEPGSTTSAPVVGPSGSSDTPAIPSTTWPSSDADGRASTGTVGNRSWARRAKSTASGTSVNGTGPTDVASPKSSPRTTSTHR
jgi:hypothetical protein